MFVFSAVLIYLVWAMYMQSDMVSVEDAEVVIVGGGISGLSAAVALQVKIHRWIKIKILSLVCIVFLQVKIHLVLGLHCFGLVEGGRCPSCPPGGSGKAWWSDLHCTGGKTIVTNVKSC